MPLTNPVAGATVATGTYTGNQTENRAIPHTLPSTPSFVAIFAGNYAFLIFINENGMIGIGAGGNTIKGVTKPNSTNFYVGIDPSWTESANLNAEVYYWVAIA